jgi:hypothetical protein
MVRSPLLKRSASSDAFPFHTEPLTSVCLWGISIPFEMLSPSSGQVNYVLLTRLPLAYSSLRTSTPVRLACIRHAASVHPEPGSNSSLVLFFCLSEWRKAPFRIDSFLSSESLFPCSFTLDGHARFREPDPQAGFCHFCGC